MLNYRSYPSIKTGYPLFLDHPVCEANQDADRKNIQKIYNIHVRSTHPLIVQIYTVSLAPLCTSVFLYIACAAMPGN